LPRILIAGCGYVGAALAAALTADGHRVWGLGRRPDALPAGVVPLAADLRDRRALGAALGTIPEDWDAAVFAAAPSGAGGEDAYRALYVGGLGHLVGALAGRASTPRRLFFTSSTAVYGQDDGSWVDEESPTEPNHWSGARMLEAEAVLFGGGPPATAVRLGGIYGPGRTGLLQSVRDGSARIVSGPPRYTNRIHRDDAAGALRHLVGRALRGEPVARLYLGVDDEPAAQADVLRWLAHRLGVPEPPEQAGAGDGRRGRTSKRCRNARLRASGFAPRYPTFREGYGALIEADASLTRR
jgi:nucleoside-diphosphate-sugar epimerase